MHGSLGNLASPLPYSVASHSSRALREAVRSVSTEQRIDLWQAEATALIDTLVDLDGVPKVIIAHNVESLIWERYAETEPMPLKSWYIRQQWRKFERFERRAFAAATRVVTVSEPDATLDKRSVRQPGRRRGRQRNRPPLLRGRPVRPRPGDDSLPGESRLAAERRRRRAAAGKDLSRCASGGARGAAADGGPQDPLQHWSSGLGRCRASSCMPTCPTSAPSWPGARSWSSRCG